MINVGFILAFKDTQWTGGINYYKNLIKSLRDHGSPDVKPVVITSPDTPIKIFEDLTGVEFITTPYVSPSSFSWKASKAAQHAFGRDIWFESFLKRHQINLISHSGHLGRNSKIPAIGWIPDFQHLRMPEFFSADEIAERNARFHRLCNWCAGIIVSSADALSDLNKFSPNTAQKADVLRFVTGVSAPSDEACKMVSDKYNLPPKFFHLPNQFWKHKNHETLIKALKILNDRNNRMTVIATGNPKDLRQPHHYEQLQGLAEDLHVTGNFISLGVVPYDEMVCLMKSSIAVVNPSLFEGWSTTVEESKSLGKKIILSDIPVHREQSPERGVYFSAQDPLALANCLQQTYEGCDDDSEAFYLADASARIDERYKEFAQSFCKIALRHVRK
ncbi:glycosyltransferase family 4 protein [Aquabacterium sp.]|uniref:glycosyltransferase family 4 protein n=1 Tax=Aquabacterium sp. TaxID=1872578 RepID=UPI0035ADDFFE